MKYLLLGAFILIINITHAQRFIWSPDSLLQSDPNYSLNRYHDILRYHDPIMYFVFPAIRPLGKRRLPLADAEGKNGYWAEGNLAYRFIIYKGKYYSYPFLQRMRLTFDVGLTTRLTNDNSSPLLPSNNKFGFGLDYLLSNPAQLNKEKANLVWTSLQLHHYSNGQADSFFIPGSIIRNNYRGGDFSTNYFKTMLNIGSSDQQKSVVSAGLGYQKEFSIGGPLVFVKELEQYYGTDRMLLSFQWTQKPRLAIVSSQNLATPEADTIQIRKRRQFGFRTEVEYIAGDLSKYIGTKKRRMAWHTYLTFMPSLTNEVGLLIHTYIGRDYLNIRFDDYVFIGELGVTVKFNSR